MRLSSPVLFTEVGKSKNKKMGKAKKENVKFCLWVDYSNGKYLWQVFVKIGSEADLMTKLLVQTRSFDIFENQIRGKVNVGYKV